MPRLSVCMIARNESADLPRCLSSAKGLADEVVVVDTGSTDDTIAIARSFDARVIEHAWRHDFAEARNVSLDAALGDWILVLDADDEVPEETHGALGAFLDAADAATPRIDGWAMLYHSPMPPGEAVSFTEHPVLRLFRNRREYRFEQAIHEQVLPSIQRAGGRVEPSDLRLTHYGYLRATVQGGDSRSQRDRDIIESVLRREPENAHLWFQLGSLALRENQLGEAELYLERAASFGDRLSVTERALTERLLSSLALQAGDARAALKHAESSLTAIPSEANSLALLNWAQAHITLGQRAANDAAAAARPDLPAQAYSEALVALEVSRRHFEAARTGYSQLALASDLAPVARQQMARNRRLCEELLGR